MKISIITPTHDPKFLRELEETIIAQTYKDWEWIILLNQGAKYESTVNSEQGKIKIIECPFTSKSVGFLKRLACMNAEGDVIAEVDHDDLITQDCLEKVARAFEDPETGFVYSNNAKLSKDFAPYLAEYGWEHSIFKWKPPRPSATPPKGGEILKQKEMKLYAMHNQPLYPGRFGHIYFAPDHIRAWRRNVYEGIGGHDDSLSVCDDLDLMHRLYLVTKFREIPETLYVYRINGENTFSKNGKTIRDLNVKLYEKNIEALAKRFCEINGLQVIENPSLEETPSPASPVSPPGGGENPLPRVNLSKMRDNSTGLIIARDCLQYVKDPIKWMGEAHRVLAPGGMLISETPSTDGRAGYMDPTAASFWNEYSFWYYTNASYAKKIQNKRMWRDCRLVTYERTIRDRIGREHKLSYVRADLEKLP